MDKAIANIIEMDDLQEEQDAPTVTDLDTVESAADVANKGDVAPSSNPQDTTHGKAEDRLDSASSIKGLFKTKTHALKKKPDSKRKYRCPVCGVVKSSVQMVNEHHKRRHKPQICRICGKSFTLASSLTRHMYDHDKCRYKCDVCNYSSHFESELKAHRIVHRKNPAFQCMVKNCAK